MPEETETAASAEGGHQDGSYLTALFTVTGFALFWVTIYALLFSASFSADNATPMEGYLLRMLFLAGFCIMPLLSATRLPDMLDTRTRRLAVRIAACVLIGVQTVLAGIPVSPPFPVLSTLWLLLGAALSEMLVFWGVIWSGIDAQRAENSFCSMCIAVSILLAALACSTMLFAPVILNTVAALISCFASALLQHVCGGRIPVTESLNVATSRSRFSLWGPSMLTAGAPALALGIALALNGLVLGVDAAFPTALIGIGTGSLASLVIIALRGSTPPASAVERVVFPVYGVCMLLLPFMADTVAFQTVATVLIADLAAYLVFHWNILVLLAYRKHLKPVYHFGQGTIATSVALALGWATITVLAFVLGDPFAEYAINGWKGLNAFTLSENGFTNLTLVGCLTAVFILILVLSIVPFASNREIEELFGAPGTENETVAAAQGDPWEAACKAICDKSGLTPRECEVFAFLARGRNAEHIAGELFISVHTAKTHTARIYRKLEINSQQQLIDIVEHAAMGAPT